MKGHSFGPSFVAETETTFCFSNYYLNIYQNVLGNYMNNFGPNNSCPPMDGRIYWNLFVSDLTKFFKSDVFDFLVSIAGWVLYSYN